MNKSFLTGAKCLALFLVFFAGGCAQKTETSASESSSNESPDIRENADFVSVDEAVEKALKAGDKMPAFSLPNAKNESVGSEELLKKSNLVLVFYRGEWCPFCNLYLKKLQDNIKEIEAAGGQLVAISVENPDDSLSVAEKNDLAFTVLSDKNLELARKFNLVYELSPETSEKYKKGGIDLAKNNETGKPELPVSATYIVNQKGIITYAFLDPDFKKRLEPNEIIAELKKIE